MIRAGLLAGLVLVGPVAAQDLPGQVLCRDVWAQLTDLAASVFSLTGQVTPSNIEGCLVTDLRIDMPGQYVPDWHIESLHLTGALPWIVDGSAPPDRLGLRLSGLRMVVQSDNPQMDYLLAAQSRTNLIDVALALRWDAPARVLTVERLEIDFPGANRVALTARVAGVDLSSKGAMQMSATSFAVTEADLRVQTHGLFEWYVLLAFGAMVLPLEGDMEAATEGLRAQAVAAVAELPETSFPAASKFALVAFVNELPNPSGTLTLSLRSVAGVGPARLMRYAMTGIPKTLAGAAPLLDGVTVNIGWTHEDQQ